MEFKSTKLKRMIDEAIGDGDTFIEPTLENGEYYVYTNLWQISTKQLDQIRKKVNVISIAIDGGSLMLTTKFKN